MNPHQRWSHTVVSAIVLSLIYSLAFIDFTPAEQKGTFTMQKIEYRGWKNNLRLSNNDVELVMTLDVGPRIISYRSINGKNVLKEFADQVGKTGESEWMIRGGHRLWVAPEDTTRTYALDNGPVEMKEIEKGAFRLTPAPEKEYGIQKEIDVRLAPSGSHISLTHSIRNISKNPAKLAPWALTVLAPGGIEIIPLPAKKPHPGSPKNAKSPADFAPNQQMVIWPFFDFKDPRWTFGQRFITLRQDAQRGPTKIGLAHQLGWVGYWNDGTMFVKRLSYVPGAAYPDNGCNFETFTNEEILEVESLGPLVELAPGKATELKEDWYLLTHVPAFKDEADIEKNILPKVAELLK